MCDLGKISDAMREEASTETVEFIFYGMDDVLPELREIMDAWYERSKQTGDKGSYVLGAGFTFEYKGIRYDMKPCSPWQGEYSWVPHVEKIQNMLSSIGATDIKWNRGWMD